MRLMRRMAGVAGVLALAGAVAVIARPSYAITNPVVTATGTELHLRFEATGQPEFVRAYLDTDRRADTGFAQAGVGADFLLENATLYRHAGAGWQWQPVGTVVHTYTGSQVSWVVPRAELGAATAGVDLVFQAEAPLETSEKIIFGYGGGVTYEPTDELIANPERGFYKHPGDCDAATFPDEALLTYREQQISLVMCVFYLDGFQDRAISDAALTTLRQRFDAVRRAGLKTVLRFAYTASPTGADAPVDRVRAHLDQLAPLLRANSDVIAVMQGGFVGAWGEGYYTRHYGNEGNVTAADWANRQAVHEKILEVLPATRAVQVRTPQMKNRYYGPDPIPGRGDSASARTGHHNDCFLASADDFGTYVDPAREYPYLAADSRFVPVGGETCAVDPARTTCAVAETELRQFHWTYLNADYEPGALARFAAGGCDTTIRRALGYRFSLVRGTYADAVTPGGTLPISITLSNNGWAAPINPRRAELILRSGDAVHRVPLAADPRTWSPGVTTVVTETPRIPGSVPPGTYDLLLALPDPQLPGRAEYAIRLANAGVWEAGTGLNNLHARVTVRS